jgi:hypothetical protein
MLTIPIVAGAALRWSAHAGRWTALPLPDVLGIRVIGNAQPRLAASASC